MEINSRGGSSDEHRAFEWSELLLGEQLYHLGIRVDHESHMIVVIINPYLLPLAVIQLPSTLHLQFTIGAGVQSEIKGETIVRCEGYHEGRIVASYRGLVKQYRFFAGCAKTEGNVAFSPARNFDVRLRSGKSHDVLLRICENLIRCRVLLLDPS